MTTVKINEVRQLADCLAADMKPGESRSLSQLATKYNTTRADVEAAANILIEEKKLTLRVENRSRMYGLPLMHREPPPPRVFRPLVLDKAMRGSIERVKEIYLYPSIG